MNQHFFTPQINLLTKFTRITKVTFLAAIVLNLGISSAFAGDPFRKNDAHQIGTQTEAAFNAIFQKGNYPKAENDLKKALTSEPNEPLAYAISASLAYGKKDWQKLELYSNKTWQTGQKLIASDPLRGNLYSAVGRFLKGALILTRQGTTNGASQAFQELQQVYAYLGKAEAITADDPELNLIKGYMDLMLAVNLPFASPDQAIERLEKNAAPRYLVDRGIAIAYRDLKAYPQALEYANKALNATADNPEIYYLKAQILQEQSKKQQNQSLIQESIVNFDQALAKKNQLPSYLVKQIEREKNQAVERLKRG